MFALSVLLGIYSYSIFSLGLSGLLTRNNIIGLTVSWLLISLFYFKDKIKIHFIKLNKFEIFIISVITLQALINLIGTLGPELGFDALWYHLTLPKIWLSEHFIRFLPGAVYQYSVMPKLTETLYTAAISLGSETVAKLIHYTFGLLILVPLYQLSRRFLNRTYSLLVLMLFYSNLIVGWESVTAYVDLARTFFEILALKLLYEDKIVRSGITLGLAITVKLIALGSLPIYVILLFLNKKSFSVILRFIFFSLLIPLPWFIFSFINTGNPFYPLLSSMYTTEKISLNIKDFWVLFTQNSDPISPIYIITAPFFFFSSRQKWGRGVLHLFLYALLSLIIWFVTPRTGGGRFILPYLPVYSLVSLILIYQLKDKLLKNILIFLIIFTSLFSVLYRSLANAKYVPVLIGRQTKSRFLFSHLNFSWGDFYDKDSVITSLIPSEQKVIVYGINNMFYLPDNFIHYTAARPQDHFDWLLIRYTDIPLPVKYLNWKIIYSDPVTKVNLLENPLNPLQ
jgi:hypothetical protein